MRTTTYLRRGKEKIYDSVKFVKFMWAGAHKVKAGTTVVILNWFQDRVSVRTAPVGVPLSILPA